MSKFIDYNSSEKAILLDVFKNVPMIDKWMINIIESYIYDWEEYRDEDDFLVKYRTKYGLKDGEAKTYDLENNLINECFFINDKLEGVGKEWYTNGNLRLKIYYKNDKQDGEFTAYYENGNICVRKFFIEDKLHGEYKEWYCGTDEQSGNLKIEFNYVDNKIEGLRREYNSDGTLRLQAEFINDKLNGEYKEWNSDVYIQRTYIDGVEVVN